MHVIHPVNWRRLPSTLFSCRRPAVLNLYAEPIAQNVGEPYQAVHFARPD